MPNVVVELLVAEESFDIGREEGGIGVLAFTTSRATLRQRWASSLSRVRTPLSRVYFSMMYEMVSSDRESCSGLIPLFVISLGTR